MLFGHSGTGKTRLLVELGTAVGGPGRRVRYVSIAAVAHELAGPKQLCRVVGRYGRLDLLSLDQLGYVRLNIRGAESLFHIITESEERASIACATNAPFSE